MVLTMDKLWVFLLAFSLMAAPNLFAGYHEGAEKCSPEKIEKMMEALDLNENQKAWMKAKHEEKKASMQESWGRIKVLKNQLHDELVKTESDPVLVQSLVDQMKELKAEKMQHRVDHFLEMKKVLTPGQFQKMMEMKKNRKHRMGKGYYKGSEKEN